MDPVTPQGRGTGTGDWTRLRSMDKLRHKPLCFGCPGERWQCLAPAISSGVLQFKQSCCSLETPPPQCDPGVLQVLQGGLSGVDIFCSAQREHCWSGTKQGFSNECQPIEIAKPSGRSVFSSLQSLSKSVGGLSWEEIFSFFLSLVLKTNACNQKGCAGGLVLTWQGKNCTVHRQQGNQ